MAEEIFYRPYVGESDLPHIMTLVQSELSEPYVIYTYRYFLHQWPQLSFLAYAPSCPTPIGVIVCKQSMHRDALNRGYIAMLSVSKDWRKRGIARNLVRRSLDVMKQDGVEEVILETEFDNAAALSLYESLGFIREKRLYRFYMNGKDAFRLLLALPTSPSSSPPGLGFAHPYSQHSHQSQQNPYSVPQYQQQQYQQQQQPISLSLLTQPGDFGAGGGGGGYGVGDREREDVDAASRSLAKRCRFVRVVPDWVAQLEEEEVSLR